MQAIDTLDDKALRELAAIALNLQGLTWEQDSACYYFDDSAAGREEWNPLESDGQAFRLAVARHIGIRAHGANHRDLPNTSIAVYNLGVIPGARILVPHADNANAATRRAIVLAAAAIVLYEQNMAAPKFMV